MVTLHTCIYVFIHSSNILYVCIALYDRSYKSSEAGKWHQNFSKILDNI